MSAGLPRYCYHVDSDMFVVVTHEPEHHEVQVVHPIWGYTSVHESSLVEASDRDVRALPPIGDMYGQQPPRH